MSFFNRFKDLMPKKQQPEPKPIPEAPKPVQEKAPEINWLDPKAKISKYFTVKEALYLPSWQVMHIPSESEKANILKMAAKMDRVRELMNNFPISVHVWIRPVLNQPGHPKHGQDYNTFIKGAKNSAHKTGEAVDWSIKGEDCDKLRIALLIKLEELELRMEDLPGSNWIHLDCRPVVGKRFFKP